MTIIRTLGFFRLAAVVCGLGFLLLGVPSRAAAQESSPVDDECFDIGYFTGCDVEGFSAVIADDKDYDFYAATSLDFEVVDDGWLAYVYADFYRDNDQNPFDGCQNEVDPNDPNADPSFIDCESVNSILLNHFYELVGGHGVFDDYGDGGDAGYTDAWFYGFQPTVTSIDPPRYAYVGSSGDIVFRGSFLLDPFYLTFGVDVRPSQGGNISGMTVTPVAALQDGTAVAVGYNIAQCGGTGGRLIDIITSFGFDSGDIVFNVGDPTPTILGVSPGVWQAGQTNLPITISGTGFGDNPTLLVAGNGVTLVSTDSKIDTRITGKVTISSGAPNQVATVTVISNGYCSSGFQAANGNPSSSSAGVPVQAQPGPTPQIYLYNQPIPPNTNVSVMVGQQIALSASVAGINSFQSQTWSTPAGTAVGGYTNASGTLPCVTLTNCPIPDIGKGQVLGLPNQSCSTCSTFTFYWVDSGEGSNDTITYNYTASDGRKGSATVTFEIDAPSGIRVAAPQIQPPPQPPPGGNIEAAATVHPPDRSSNGYPILGVGYLSGNNNTSFYGFVVQATANYFPTGGQYQWAQLLGDVHFKRIANIGPQTCTVATAPPNSPPNTLDDQYPYPSQTINANQPHDFTNDQPNQPLGHWFGEAAESFNATMYLMWLPPTLSGTYTCPTGNACTIPVPQGNVQWDWWGDTVNTLIQDPHSPRNMPYPIWNLGNGSPVGSPAYNSEDTSFPKWDKVVYSGGINANYTCIQGR